jgi:hypothetical protein
MSGVLDPARGEAVPALSGVDGTEKLINVPADLSENAMFQIKYAP